GDQDSIRPSQHPTPNTQHRERSAMPLIDAHTVFGFWPLEKVDLSVDTLQTVMRARNVARSLAYSAKALFYDAGEGNDDTVTVCGQRPELLPVAVLDPRAYPACLEESR